MLNLFKIKYILLFFVGCVFHSSPISALVHNFKA